MTTNELIKILQEADPDGTAHVRMSGGVPICAVCKEGYWDGPYSYINDKNEWVYSAMNNKVDIYCRDIDEFVSEMISTYNYPTWEETKEKFKFELDCYAPERQAEKIGAVLKQVREVYDDTIQMYNSMQKEDIERALNNSLKGWVWFQNKLVDDLSLKPNLHHYYTWKVYDENGKLQDSNLLNVEAVYKSGLFEKIDNNVVEGYYQWILKIK